MAATYQGQFRSEIVLKLLGGLDETMMLSDKAEQDSELQISQVVDILKKDLTVHRCRS